MSFQEELAGEESVFEEQEDKMNKTLFFMSTCSPSSADTNSIITVPSGCSKKIFFKTCKRTPSLKDWKPPV